MNEYNFIVHAQKGELTNAPRVAGVYIITAYAKAIYIGQTKNIKERLWMLFSPSGHIYEYLQYIERDEMSLLFFAQDDCDKATGASDNSSRRLIESLLITNLKPVINKQKHAPGFYGDYAKYTRPGIDEGILSLFVGNERYVDIWDITL